MLPWWRRDWIRTRKTIPKVRGFKFIYLLLFFLFATPRSMWDLSSSSRKCGVCMKGGGVGAGGGGGWRWQMP